MIRFLIQKKIFIALFGLIFIVFISYRIFIDVFQEYEELNKTTSNSISQEESYKFKSLRSNKTNVRQGPSLGHDILWTYQKKNLPIEVLEDIQGWSRVRDFEAETGWIKNTLISLVRTGIIAPWNTEDKDADLINVYRQKDIKKLEMKLQSGAIVKILECDGLHCKILAGNREGWVNQNLIFGVYQGEVIVLKE